MTFFNPSHVVYITVYEGFILTVRPTFMLTEFSSEATDNPYVLAFGCTDILALNKIVIFLKDGIRVSLW